MFALPFYLQLLFVLAVVICFGGPHSGSGLVVVIAVSVVVFGVIVTMLLLLLLLLLVLFLLSWLEDFGLSSFALVSRMLKTWAAVESSHTPLPPLFSNVSTLSKQRGCNSKLL